ncbi:hypothetical protein AB0B10_15735 [Micromonospora arborensis]|uniref:hypothetical protein n=1 Tax=Micromonospora arborensis TaxID=2116518 RepID=UPI0033C1225A
MATFKHVKQTNVGAAKVDHGPGLSADEIACERREVSQGPCRRQLFASRNRLTAQVNPTFLATNSRIGLTEQAATVHGTNTTS